MDNSKLVKEKYNSFKVQMVKKYIDMFPLYRIPVIIMDEFSNKGYSLKDKREALTTALNNTFFKLKKDNK
jgi:hypothetical protein